MLIVNAVQAFDAVIADDVCVTVTASAQAFIPTISSRKGLIADLIAAHMLKQRRI
jgi:hypothetical protein